MGGGGEGEVSSATAVSPCTRRSPVASDVDDLLTKKVIHTHTHTHTETRHTALFGTDSWKKKRKNSFRQFAQCSHRPGKIGVGVGAREVAGWGGGEGRGGAGGSGGGGGDERSTSLYNDDVFRVLKGVKISKRINYARDELLAAECLE